MNPLIIYVDDEPRNLTVFEASVPEDWRVKCYDSAVEALKTIKEMNPCLIISDQKMPGMTGLEFLEVASQLVPEAIRIVVTGQTEEQTIIQLVRRAKIFDYLTKPWDTETLISQLKKGIEYYQALADRKQAFELLKQKNAELEGANTRERELRKEIGAWSPAPIVWAINEKKLQFPVTRDLVTITYDIVDSASLLDAVVGDRSVRSHVVKLFSQALMKMGGLRESCSGDSVYGHFGAVTFPHNPFVAAMMAAEEFRVTLQSFTKLNNVNVNCGIALHHAPQTLVHLNEVRAETPNGELIQKWIDTDSAQIDLLHRIEKLVHQLPGTNLIMSDDFLKNLPSPSPRIVALGTAMIKGQKDPIGLHLLPGEQTTPKMVEEFKAKYFAVPLKQAA